MKAISREIVFWFILLVAALFEVGGDALIREGEKVRGLSFIIPGFLILGSYGIVINVLSGPTWISGFVNLNLFKSLGLDVSFSMMLGVYVSVFATVSILGDYFFGSKKVPTSTWLGLIIILIGGLIVRYGKM